MRRNYVVLAAAIAVALLLAACSGGDDERPEAAGGDPTPRAAGTDQQQAAPPRETSPVSVALQVEAGAWWAPVVNETAANVAPQHAVGINDGVGQADATLRVSHADSPQTRASADLQLWAPFVAFWSERRSVNLEELNRAPLILPAESRASLESMLVLGTHPALQWVPQAQLEPALNEAPDAITMLPVRVASPGLRSLEIGGVDPVRGVGDASNWPLVERVHFSWDFAPIDNFANALAGSFTLEEPAVTRMMFVGDIIPARCVYGQVRERGDYAWPFRPTADVLRAADLTIGSLDAAISNVGEPYGCVRTFNLMAPAGTMEGLELAGFDAMAVATNHIQDCGTTGIGCEGRAFMDTLARLSNAGIAYFGGGENLAAAHEPAILEHGGVRFAFLAYDEIAAHYYGATQTAPGTASLERDLMLRDIEAAKLIADVVIVVPHWGVEYEHNPNSRQLSLARDAIDAGATLVVGNHPHVVQGIEWRGEGFAAYSLGNFIFDQPWSIPTQQSYALETTFHGDRLVGVRLLPVRINAAFQATWAEPGEAAQIMQDIENSSRNIAAR